ncbi:D-aminoacyl-tRNA deacylase [Spirulina major]|uniref:D-aminoacyl-tRNA deacylase n=1 Tax=Spirulina major TaxID=270636 RepID=UPI000ADEFA3C|nr:D-aminoacyl-tRNA deacylase [Spirulina major]
MENGGFTLYIRKCLNLRIFPSPDGQAWAQSVQEIGGELLVISQFTLYGDGRKGRRPSFSGSARPEQAEILYDRFVELLRAEGITVATGQFGAMMQVEIHNDGPVTLWLERDAATA